MTLSDLLKLAEKSGALIVPDEVDGPEVVLDSESFEKFTDALYALGIDCGIALVQEAVDRRKITGALQ